MGPARAVLGLALVAAAAVCGAQPLPAGTDECLERIELQRAAPSGQRSDAPLLGDICPELVEALHEAQWSDSVVGVSSLRDLHAPAFVELAVLIERYAEPERSQPLSFVTLDAALAELEVGTPPVQLSWWERAVQWLQERLGRGGDGDDAWLEKWLSGISLPDRLVRWLVLAAALLLLGATLVIVGNELRVAGAFGARLGRRRVAVDGGDDGPSAVRAPTLADVRAAPLVERPVLLLALLLEQWRRRGGDAIRPSLTHRELARTAENLEGTERESLLAVLDAAERVTFGAWRPAESEVDGVLTHGEALLASWSADRGERR